MQLIDVGKPSGSKGSEDIEGLGILMIALDEGVGSILVLVVIGNPIHHPSNLDNGKSTAVRQYQRHLQDGLEGIANVVDVVFRQRLGRIIPEKAEPLTLAGPTQTLLEGPNLAGEHQGCISAFILYGMEERELIISIYFLRKRIIDLHTSRYVSQTPHTT